MHKTRWDDLTYILAVAECGSLSAAARQLGVNHATVLRRIASFEDAHAVQLFERSPNGYVLRPECRPFLEPIRDISRSVGSLERAITGQRDTLAGPVRLTSTDSICQFILAPAIPKFHARFPDVTIELISTNSHLNLSRLDADLTIRPTRALSAELTGRKVGALGLGIYGSVGYLSANTSDRVESHSWLGLSKDLARSPVLNWQDSAVPEDRIVFQADSFNTLAEAAAAGLGLAMLPCHLGTLVAGLVPASRFTDRLLIDIWVASHPDIANAPLIARCADFFAALIEQNDELLRGPGSE